MKDIGELVWMLGMHITRDRGARTMKVTQTAYVNRLLEKFGMSECKPVATPMEGNLSKLEDQDAKPDREYMMLVGGLLYAARVSRPDISFAVKSLGQHTTAVGSQHWVAAKRVLRYLKGTSDIGIKYTGNTNGSFRLVTYADADYAGDLIGRKSTTGNFFTLSHERDVNPIDWTSKQQEVVATSSAESEFISACYAAKTIMHFRQLLTDVGMEQKGPTIIMEDNQACIAMSENPGLHRKTRHIDVRFHYLRDMVDKGNVKLVYVPTEHQLADLFTKPLYSMRHAMLRDRVMGRAS